MFIFLTSLSDNLDRQNGRVSALENLCQQNKPFSDFILEFTWLMNNISYKNDQSKNDIFSVKLSNETNQLLTGQDISFNYLRYVIWLYLLDIDVFVAHQRKNIRVNLRSTTLMQAILEP